MKVVLLSTSSPGAHGQEMMAGLHQGGVDVRMYASDLSAGRLPAATAANELGARVRAVTDQWRPDVFHAMDPLAGVAAHIASGRRAAVVQQLPTLAAVERRASMSAHDFSRAVFLERRLLRRASVVVAGCTEQAMELIQLRVPAGRVRLVEAAVDPREYDVPAHCGSERSPIRLLAPGGPDRTSGAADVVRALVRIPQASLSVAGGTRDEADRLLALARRLHVGHRVRWIGPIDVGDMPAVYRDAHIVVHAPWREWSARTALEAVACRRPLVATATGALLDTLADLPGVSLVPVHTPDAIADALARIVDRAPAEWTGTLEAARDALVRRHSWSARVRLLADVYECAVANRRAGAELALGVA